MGNGRALQASASAHKALHLSEAPPEPAWVLLHNLATCTGLLSTQQAGLSSREATDLPQTAKHQHRKKSLDASCLLCSEAGARPSTSAPSCTEPRSLSVRQQQATKTIFKTQFVLKTKHSLPFLSTQSPSTRTPSSSNKPGAQCTAAPGCQALAGPPLGSRPHLLLRKARGRRGFARSSRSYSCPTGLLSCPTSLLFPCNPP